MAKRQFYKKVDYERIDFIIKTIGEKKRQVKLDYVESLTERNYPYEAKQVQESWIYFDSIWERLEYGLKLIKRNKTLVGLTEEGIHLYEENIGIETYLKGKKKEKLLKHGKQWADFILVCVKIICAIIPIGIAKLSTVADDFWKNLLLILASLMIGAVLASPIGKLLKSLFQWKSDRID